MPSKRVRHAGGESRVYTEDNEFGEWSVAVEPENLLVDTHHARGRAHVHDPREYGRRIPVRDVGSRETLHRVMLHLVHNGGVRLDDLIAELNNP